MNGTYLVCKHNDCLREYIHQTRIHVHGSQICLSMVYLCVTMNDLDVCSEFIFKSYIYIHNMGLHLDKVEGSNIRVHFG